MNFAHFVDQTIHLKQCEVLPIQFLKDCTTPAGVVQSFTGPCRLYQKVLIQFSKIYSSTNFIIFSGTMDELDIVSAITGGSVTLTDLSNNINREQAMANTNIQHQEPSNNQQTISDFLNGRFDLDLVSNPGNPSPKYVEGCPEWIQPLVGPPQFVEPKNKQL